VADAADARDAVTAQAEPAEPHWPAESAESAMLAEVRVRDTQPLSAAGGPDVASPLPSAADKKNLPPLDPLVARLPAETRAALDELFRAKFTAVRRVPESALKS
jgi:hypothetical protein